MPLLTKSVVLRNQFFSFKTNVVYDIIVHVHKNSFYLYVGGNHFELESQI